MKIPLEIQMHALGGLDDRHQKAGGPDVSGYPELSHQVDLHRNISRAHRDDRGLEHPERFVQHEGQRREMVVEGIENDIASSYSAGIEGLSPAPVLIIPFPGFIDRSG